jgi:hypothetical protein
MDPTSQKEPLAGSILHSAKGVEGMKGNKFLLGLILILALALTACGSDTPTPDEEPAPVEPTDEEMAEPTPEPTDEPDTGYDSFAPFAGTWSGTWTNTTFGSTGPIEATLEFNMDGTGTFTFDAGGVVFGMFDPPAITLPATFDASGVTIDLPGDEFFGDVTVTFNPDGTFNMVGDLIPAAGIAKVEATGTFTESSMDGTYTVFFDGSDVAEGTVMMTKAE